MFKLNKKNIDKTVLMMVNRAINFKVSCILQDELSNDRDSFWMAQSLNCHTLVMFDNYINNMEMSQKDFFNTYTEDYLEREVTRADIHNLFNQITPIIIDKIETFIYKKEVELFNIIQEKVREEHYKEIEKEKFNKTKRAM